MIIDFNKGNGGGMPSSALTNYWDSAVTEEHIESASSIVYASAASYTDQAVAGIDLSDYYTSAQTVEAIAASVSGKADAKILVDFDKTSQAERASVYSDLYTLYSGGSGATINRNYDFYKTVGTYQGLKIDYYSFSGGSLVFGKVVSPTNTEDEVVYEQVMTIDSAGNVNVVTNIVGDSPDLSAYWTSGETKEYVDKRIDGYESAETLTQGVTDQQLRVEGSVNCSAGDIGFQAIGNVFCLTNKSNYEIYHLPADPEFGTINYYRINDLYETDGTGIPTGVYYAFPEVGAAGGTFVEGQPVQLTTTNFEPSSVNYYTATGGGFLIYDKVNKTLTWSTQPVVDVHIPGVYDSAVSYTDAAIADLSFVSSADVQTQIEGYNYVTSAQVETQVLDKNYITSAQAETQILEKEYITAEDIEPDVIYEAEGNDPGFYAINSSALTTWQIENLDLSPYQFVRFYIKASDVGFNSSDNFTAPMYVDVVLDPKSLSSQYQAYLGVTSNICAGNRNRSFHTVAAVDITKSKVQLLYQVSLWDITTSSAANNGRYCYKIEGYRYNVCGAAENGGGGGTYTAGPNIDISPAGVISVSGLSTINGSAITNGGNIVIQGGGGDMSAYMTSGDAQVISTALNDLEDRKVESSDQSIHNIIKIEQSDYDALVAQSATTPTTLYVVIPDQI